MGLFSSKTKTFVDTQVMRVIPDAQVPDTVSASVITSIFKTRDIVAGLQQDILGNASGKFSRAYQYAKSGEYFYGLPEATTVSGDQGREEAKLVLDTLTGRDVTIDYLRFRPINNFHLGWQEVTDTYGYSFEHNTLSTLSAEKGAPVYLDDLVAVYPPDLDYESTALGSFSESPTSKPTPERPVAAEAVGLGKYSVGSSWKAGSIFGVEIHYVWKDTSGNLQGEFIFVDLSSYDLADTYFQARYTYVDTGSITRQKYFTYSPLEGTYPKLDAIHRVDYTHAGDHFPFIVFRQDGQNRASPQNHDTEAYKTTSNLLKYLGIDFYSLATDLHANPDIDDVEHAIMLMGVPYDSSHPTDMAYLFRHFSDLAELFPVQGGADIDDIENRLLGQTSQHAVRIQDAGFEMYLSFSGISKKTKAGSIGPIGSYTNTQGSFNPPGLTAADIAEGADIPALLPTRIFRRQVSDSAYVEVTIINLALRFPFADGYQDVASSSDGNLLIPLHWETSLELPRSEREILYYRSLHFVFNARVEHKVEWYERSWFRAVLIIIAVVVTIISYGQAWETIVAAAEVGATAVALAVLKIVAVSFAVQASFEVAAQFLSTEVLIVLALVLAAVGGVRALTSGNAGQDAWATHLISAASGLIKAESKKYGDLIDDVLAEAALFEDYAEGKWEELESTQKLLDYKNLLNPYEFIGMEPLYVLGESPPDFFNRTVHSGNVGTLCFDILENYVDISLKLPTIEDTLGDPTR